MAKEQKRGNKETRKPKSKKETVAAPVGLVQGINAAAASAAKKAKK